MNDNTFWILFTTVMAASLGLMGGCGPRDEVRRRKNAEDRIDELNERLETASFKTSPLEAQFMKMAMVLDDAHKKITDVSRVLEKRAQ